MKSILFVFYMKMVFLVWYGYSNEYSKTEGFLIDYGNTWAWYYDGWVTGLKTRFGLPAQFYLSPLTTWYQLRDRQQKSLGHSKQYDLINTAPYDVPYFLQNEHAGPVPRAVMGGHCAPGNELKRADFYYDVSYEVYLDSVAKAEAFEKWQMHSMYGDEWLVPFNFYFLLCWCNIGRDIEKACFNPCANNPCELDKHSTKKCQVQFDKNGEMKSKIALKYREYFAKIYNRIHVCSCDRGYSWSTEEKKCVKTSKDCDDPLYGDSKSPCRNDAVCHSLSVRDRKDPDITFRCECLPAWTGYLCEKPYDPCSSPENDEICGFNQCRREPKSRTFGFICECLPGLEASVLNPACVDIDECAVTSGLCQNGGKCVNLKPELDFYTMTTTAGYRCDCMPGFWGTNCEKVDKENAGWSNWSKWSTCSMSCGIGTRERHRTCILLNQDMCIGSNFDRQYCIGQRISCDQASKNEYGDTVFQQGEMIVKEWEYENEAFSDPWSWSEQQFFKVPTKNDYAMQTYSLIWRIMIRTSDFLELCKFPFLFNYLTAQELVAICAGMAIGSMTVIGLINIFKFLCKSSVRESNRQSYVVRTSTSTSS